MVQSGIGVWVVWSGQLDTAFDAMLAEYGGFRMAEAPGQALWYFFDDEAFRVLARIFVWGQVTPIPVFVEVFTASMLVGPKFERSLTMSVELSRQNATPGDGVEILVHPNLKGHIPLIPGLTSTPAKSATGLARVAFERLEAIPTWPMNRIWTGCVSCIPWEIPSSGTRPRVGATSPRNSWMSWTGWGSSSYATRPSSCSKRAGCGFSAPGAGTSSPASHASRRRPTPARKDSSIATGRAFWPPYRPRAAPWARTCPAAWGWIGTSWPRTIRT